MDLFWGMKMNPVNDRLKHLRPGPSVHLVFFICLALATAGVAYYLFFHQPDNYQLTPEIVVETEHGPNLKPVDGKLTYSFNDDERRSLRLTASRMMSRALEEQRQSSRAPVRQPPKNQFHEEDMVSLPADLPSGDRTAAAGPTGETSVSQPPAKDDGPLAADVITFDTPAVSDPEKETVENDAPSSSDAAEPADPASNTPVMETDMPSGQVPEARIAVNTTLTPAGPEQDNSGKETGGDDASILPEPFHPEGGAYVWPRSVDRIDQSMAGAGETQEKIWVVNTLSTQELDKVREVFTVLPKKDFAIYSYKTNVNGKEWFRIRVGFFTSRQEAEEVGQRLAKQYALPEPWVVRPGPQELATYYQR